LALDVKAKQAMSPPLARIILYVKDIPKVAAFYRKHFAFRTMPGETGTWLELESPSGGCTIALHQAAKSQKSGAAMKIVFAVRDVRKFKAKCMRNGLKFGPVHEPGGFEYANAKDPAGNSISISSRGLGK
jgi:predicted enzyme related to lactoylglutathione lyase